jgi:hypothetical protein
MSMLQPGRPMDRFAAGPIAGAVCCRRSMGPHRDAAQIAARGDPIAWWRARKPAPAAPA